MSDHQDHKKVVIPEEDKKYEAHTGMPFGIDDKINGIDLNNDGKSDVVQAAKFAEKVLPPLLSFVKNGGLLAVEKAIGPHLSPEALQDLQELEAAVQTMAKLA